MKSIGLSFVFVFVLISNVSAQPFWSIGPKVGYTFGKEAGLLWGFEVTYFPVRPVRYGVTMDVAFTKFRTSIHVGAETWILLGVDSGPTILISNDVRFAWSLIVWEGLFLYPYYQFDLALDGQAGHSLGAYLKVPVGLGESSGGAGLSLH
jgi:hypothetical protein